MKIQGRRRGFTLLELLVVVAILAVIAGVVISQFDRLEDQASEGASTHTIAALDGAIRTFKVSTGNFPDEMDSLITDDASAPETYVGLTTKLKGTGGTAF